MGGKTATRQSFSRFIEPKLISIEVKDVWRKVILPRLKKGMTIE
jgi:hypothetical protein